jgi:hypothetical protein
MFQLEEVNTKINQGADKHIAADAAKGVEKKGIHQESGAARGHI